jgi:serine/threonine protein kinase
MRIDRIGEFAVLAALGSGAAGRVLHIRRKADARAYALKVVPLGGGVNRKYLEQARREYRVGRMLDHPNLARIHALEIEKD